MKKIITSLLIGTIVGTIDVIPMIIQGLDWYSNISAFVFWIVMGFVIAYISIPLKSWKKGLLVATLSILPIIIIVAASDPISIIPISIMTIILGSLVGFLTDKYAK
ncbi:MAG: hypothetical protein HQ541_12810 [Mariniphaga sp.]|nr:hypothetical protein [Mariniphaga sp.]